VGALVKTGAATTAANKYTTVANELQFFASDEWNASGQVKTFLTAGKGTIADLDGNGTYTTPASGVTDSYYYYTDTVYLKAGQASKIYLDSTNTGIAYTASNGKAAVLKYGESAANYKAALDDTATANVDESAAMYNLVKTLRVAFVVTQTDTKNTAETSDDETTRTVYFYELNNGLIDEQTTTNTGGTSYSTTINGANGLTAGVSAADATTAYSSTNISNLSSGAIKTIDSATVEGSATAMVTTTAASGKDVLATVKANEEIQVDIYMWMEGCDYDTTAANSAKFDTTIKGLQFGFCIGDAS
jgi:hypothetical protein